MRILSVNILIFIFCAVLKLPAQKGQSVSPSLPVNAGKQNTILQYEAFADNKYRIKLHLEREDSLWQGMCYYPSSNTKLYLQGDGKDNELLLFEKDSLGNASGVWLLNLNPENPTGKWRNINGTVEFTVSLMPAGNKKNHTGNTDIEIFFYHGKIFNDKYILTLYSDKTRPRASLLNASENIFITNKIKCADDDCNKFVIKTNHYDKIKKLECSKNNAITLKAEVSNHFDGKSTSVFNLMEKLKMKNTAYINRDFMFNIFYPVFETQKINASFQKEIQRIADNLKFELDSVTKQKGDINNRLNTFAGAWFDVDYYSPELFSGKFFIQKSYNDKITVIPVIFNLQTGKKTNILEQFEPDFNFLFFARQYLNEHIKHMPEYKSSMLRNFLSPVNFKYFTVNDTGIVISTGFNTVFGDYKLIIPFDELKNNIKRRSILRKLIHY